MWISHFLSWGVNTGLETDAAAPGPCQPRYHLTPSSFREMTGKGWSVKCVTTKKSPGDQVKWPADSICRLREWAPPANIHPCSHVVHAPVILTGFTEMPHHHTSSSKGSEQVASRHRLMLPGRLRWCWSLLSRLNATSYVGVATADCCLNGHKNNKTLPFPILTTTQET